MIELRGKYNIAKVYTDNIEPTALSQIIELCNQEFVKDSKIAIMPDVHAGAGCTIGTTMTLTNTVVPNLVGVDIGCGMFCVELKEKEIDLELLDNTILRTIPSGQNVRAKEHAYNKYVTLDKLKCVKHIKMDRARKSIGTLGGGNHFIELNRCEDNTLYLVIHSGSRYLGKQVAEYYQDIAFKYHTRFHERKQEMANKLKAEGRYSEIEDALRSMERPKINKALCYLEDEDFDNYMHDMKIAQFYATMNREAMADIILKELKLTEVRSFHTIHNYIDMNSMILRKGAVSAQKGEDLLIPINMRDGSLLCVGKGNPEWNYSVAHGAGRVLSRSKAKVAISLEEFEKSMEGIYSSSVCSATIDEAPMAYKPIDEIVNNIGDTVDIVDIIKPIYNFKAH